jgi:rare lipoprotein A
VPLRQPPPQPQGSVPPVAARPAQPRPSDAELLALPDAVPRAEPRARLGNPPVYEVFGQRYFVLPSAKGYVARGVASWYGPDFHGERTSTGEPYDMYSMTAAHPALPLPAYARVTNLANGRSVVVRVNDRGPFKANRIIDLSYAAALKLDMIRNGTTLVEVRGLEPDDATAPQPAPPPAPIYAQAGAFALQDNAERLRARLRGEGIGNVLVSSDASSGRTLFRVRIGPIGSVAEFDGLVARVRALGLGALRLAID